MRISLGGRNSNNLSSSKSVAIAGVIAVVGMAVLAYGFTQYRAQSQSVDQAVNVTATVVSTGIEEDASRRGGIDYMTDIRFKYSYEGNQYTSNNIYPLDSSKDFNTRSAAEDFLEDFPEGNQVQAYVNPENPGKGFLNAQRSNDPLILMLIGALSMAIGGYNSVKNLV